MAKKTKVVAWDTCVIIDAIQRTADKWEKISPIIMDAESGDMKIVISEMSLVECNHLESPASSMSLAEQHKLIDAWFESPYLIRRPIHQGITHEAIKLSRQYNLTAPDAIVLATAIKNRVGILHTGDGSGRKKGKRLIPLSGKIGNPPLVICEPNPSQLYLDYEQRS